MKHKVTMTIPNELMLKFVQAGMYHYCGVFEEGNVVEVTTERYASGDFKVVVEVPFNTDAETVSPAELLGPAG